MKKLIIFTTILFFCYPASSFCSQYTLCKQIASYAEVVEKGHQYGIKREQFLDELTRANTGFISSIIIHYANKAVIKIYQHPIKTTTLGKKKRY